MIPKKGNIVCESERGGEDMTKMEADHAKEDPFFVANRERKKNGEIGGRRGLFLSV